jgi:BirA family transcriptional regulator, biotin operon repressor / biotin---[acetyl-CoA-carboxylase] ligase
MIGQPHVHHRVTDSTNERARALAEAGAPHGTIVTAGEQTEGRGRQGRTWTAAPGEALLVSMIVRGLEPRHALLPLMAALAVCDAAEAVASVSCRIKWPNDVWVERRKLSGILVEARPAAGWAVVGIGLNTGVARFPDELRDTATSLALRSPEEALAPLATALERWASADASEVLPAWRERDALQGEPVRWADGEGTARGIDDAGSLLVETVTGELALGAGEVHLLRPAASAAESDTPSAAQSHTPSSGSDTRSPGSDTSNA